MQQSGGVTKIESQIGRGTTVVMYLPHSPSDAIHDQTPLPQPTIPVSQGRRILVLDDDRQVRETVAAMLDTAGYTVVSFASARQALHEIGETKPIDLMIVDYAMPDMRGDQFAAEARLQRPTVPVLFITGYAEPTSLQSERFVLRKPFSVAALNFDHRGRYPACGVNQPVLRERRNHQRRRQLTFRYKLISCMHPAEH